MSQETHWEDQMINAAVEALERGTDPSAPTARGVETAETAETLARLYTEVVGLIPYELTPVVPSPEAKQRLFAAISGGGVATASRPVAAPPHAEAPRPVVPAAPAPVFAPEPLPEPAPPAAVVAETAETAEAAETGETVGRVQPVQPISAARRQPPRPVPLSAARRPLGWPAALAAGLALVLAGFSGWLYQRQADQREIIAALRGELQEARQREALATQKAENYRTEFTQMRTTMTLVTAPAALVSPLRPVGVMQPDARGALFVAADHQHWHLSIEGLKPATTDKVYQLWFVAEQGPPVNGGTFVAKPNERVELSSEAMPPDTRSAMITLEPAGGARAPSGPEVLRGAGMIQIL